MDKAVLFIDMDGVLVDFIRGVIQWYDLPFKHDDVDGWDVIVDKSGMSLTEFWQGLDDRNFWIGLKMYDYAPELLKMIEDEVNADPCLLTSPAWHTAGYKQDWIQEFLPDYFNNGRYLIGPGKGYCAFHGAFLLDDSDSNCELFAQYKGQPILFPQPWNKNRDVKVNPVDYVRSQLEVFGLIP